MVHRVLDIYGRAELDPAPAIRPGDPWGVISTISRSDVLFAIGRGAASPLASEDCRRAIELWAAAKHDYFGEESQPLVTHGQRLKVTFIERRPPGEPVWAIVVEDPSGDLAAWWRTRDARP